MKFDKNLCLFCKSKFISDSNYYNQCNNCHFKYAANIQEYIEFYDFETENFIITRIY